MANFVGSSARAASTVIVLPVTPTCVTGVPLANEPPDIFLTFSTIVLALTRSVHAKVPSVLPSRYSPLLAGAACGQLCPSSTIDPVPSGVMVMSPSSPSTMVMVPESVPKFVFITRF